MLNLFRIPTCADPDCKDCEGKEESDLVALLDTHEQDALICHVASMKLFIVDLQVFNKLATPELEYAGEDR